MCAKYLLLFVNRDADYLIDSYRFLAKATIKNSKQFDVLFRSFFGSNLDKSTY